MPREKLLAILLDINTIFYTFLHFFSTREIQTTVHRHWHVEHRGSFSLKNSVIPTRVQFGLHAGFLDGARAQKGEKVYEEDTKKKNAQNLLNTRFLPEDNERTLMKESKYLSVRKWAPSITEQSKKDVKSDLQTNCLCNYLGEVRCMNNVAFFRLGI